MQWDSLGHILCLSDWFESLNQQAQKWHECAWSRYLSGCKIILYSVTDLLIPFLEVHECS